MSYMHVDDYGIEGYLTERFALPIIITPASKSFTFQLTALTKRNAKTYSFYQRCILFRMCVIESEATTCCTHA